MLMHPEADDVKCKGKRPDTLKRGRRADLILKHFSDGAAFSAPRKGLCSDYPQR